MLADPNHIASGCGMLLDYIEKRNKDENRKQLFDANNETAQLKFCLTEIPAKAVAKPIRIALPHPLYYFVLLDDLLSFT